MAGSSKYLKDVSGCQPEMEQVTDLLRENQKLITLGRLAASIAHEINNPLESVTNLLYLSERANSEDTTAYLRTARRELERAVQIARQTLSFSRETNAPVRIDLADLIEEALGLYARAVRGKQIRILRRYEERSMAPVFPGEIRQVLANLISNSIEASRQNGSIVIRLRNSSRWTHRGRERGIRFTIGDSGSGIPAELLDRIGQPFFTTKGQSGTGLGLWVTQSILSHYGSSLQVRSSVRPPQRGTVFSFVLPHRLGPIEVMSGDIEVNLKENVPRTQKEHGPCLVTRQAGGMKSSSTASSDWEGRSPRTIDQAATKD